MGIRIPRKKPRHFLLAMIYRIQKLVPLGSTAKMKLFLDLEWIFDRLAMEASFQYYNVEAHPFRSNAREFLLHRIGPGNVVLDVGCNAGHVTSMIATKAGKVVGVDHDGEAIAAAKKAHSAPNLTFLHMDALAYLESNEINFDVLILSHILEHLDDPERFLVRFKQFFSKIYIELPDFDKTYLNQYRKDLGSTLIYTDDDHVSEFDRYELAVLLAKCGITIKESEYKFGIQRLWCEVER